MHGLLLWGLAALATEGTPSELELLGYDPGERKVFVLVQEEFPEVSYVQLDQPAEWVLVDVWSQGAGWEARFPAWLAALRARLVPLEPVSWDSLQLTEAVTAQVPCPDVDPELGCVAQQVSLQASLDGRAARWTHTSGSRARVIAAYALPTGDRLIVYTHLGKLYEGGYTTQHAIVLTIDG